MYVVLGFGLVEENEIDQKKKKLPFKSLKTQMQFNLLCK